MKKITATKKLYMCGNSLAVNLTAEAQILGKGRGDYVEVTIVDPEDKDYIEEKDD